MKSIKKITFDELERTMSIIQKTEQMNYLGEGGTTYHFNNEQELYNFLNNWSSTEIQYVGFSDGTFAAYHDDQNTYTQSHIQITKQGGSFYFNGRQIIERGHLHHVSSDASDSDRAFACQVTVPSYIFYQGGYYNYSCNNY